MKQSIILFLTFVVLSVAFSGCAHLDPYFNLPDDGEEDTVLVFGTYYGFCLGDCTHLYKLEDGQLFGDQGIDNLYLYADRELPFQSEARPGEDYDRARILLDEFPNDLLGEEEETLGIPDAYDQGGIYLELRRGEATNRWYLDTNVEALPDYVQDYATMVKAIVEQL